MEDTVLRIENFSAGYGKKQVIKKVNLHIPRYQITAIMGPSGCGKTTLIRCINRMHEVNPDAWHEGVIYLKDQNIFTMHPITLRRKIGMVFQKPNPFPTMSIYDNVISGYILNGIRISKDERDYLVQESLSKAYLWEEVKDSLQKKGTFLSGGQQQRLCIARSLAMKPEVLLLDEPTSALDPKATAMIEELLIELKNTVTIVLVTHNRASAARVSDYTAFLYLGELIEFDSSSKMFTAPRNEKTEEYLTGKFG